MCHHLHTAQQRRNNFFNICNDVKYCMQQLWCESMRHTLSYWGCTYKEGENENIIWQEFNSMTLAFKFCTSFVFSFFEMQSNSNFWESVSFSIFSICHFEFFNLCAISTIKVILAQLMKTSIVQVWVKWHRQCVRVSPHFASHCIGKLENRICI